MHIVVQTMKGLNIYGYIDIPKYPQFASENQSHLVAKIGKYIQLKLLLTPKIYDPKIVRLFRKFNNLRDIIYSRRDSVKVNEPCMSTPAT